MSSTIESTRRRPLSRSDIVVSRLVGVVIVGILGLILYWLVFSPFEEKVPGHALNFAEYITCPSSWSMLFGDPVLEGSLDSSTLSGSIHADLCIRVSRTRTLGAAAAALVLVPGGLWFLLRRTMPPSLPPLPPRPGSLDSDDELAT